MPDPSAARQAATQLRVIRIALTAGVLAFAVVAHQLIGAGALRSELDPALMRWANAAVLLGAVLAILHFQRRHEAEADPRKRQSLNVFAWAAGETAALFGIVHWMLVGSPIPFYVGLATMLAAFVLVPIRE